MYRPQGPRPRGEDLIIADIDFVSVVADKNDTLKLDASGSNIGVTNNLNQEKSPITETFTAKNDFFGF
jgi:hypothetical protein